MRIALDESYLPDEDIRLIFTDKLQEIKSTHPLRAYIPPRSLPTVSKLPCCDYGLPPFFLHLKPSGSSDPPYVMRFLHNGIPSLRRKMHTSCTWVASDLSLT